MSARRIVTQAAGTLDYSSVTASYTTLQGPIAGRGVTILIANSLSGGVMLSLDGGTTDFIRLPAGTGTAIDLGSNGAHYSGTISVKYDSGGASISGFISCGVIRVN